MNRKVLGIIVVAAILVSTTGFAQKAEQRKDRGNRDEMQLQPNRDMYQRGERIQFFTREQQEAIKKIRLETAKEMKPFQNELNELEAHQHTLATADKADMNAIYKNIEEIGKVKTGLAKIRAKEQQDIRKLLTGEQLLAIDKFKERRFEGERRKPGTNRMDRPGRPEKQPFERGE